MASQDAPGQGTRAYNVLVPCDYFEPAFLAGGAVRSLTQLLDTAPRGVRVTLLTSDRDLGCSSPFAGLSDRWVTRGPHRIFYLDMGRRGRAWRLLREMRRHRYDLLYLNSLWSREFTLLPLLWGLLGLISCRRIVLAPRGELMPGALGIRPARKKIVGRLLRLVAGPTNLQFHASGADEAAAISRHFPRSPVITVQDQVRLPAQALEPKPTRSDMPSFVYIGRISPKKNLLATLRALGQVESPVSFTIHGPVDDKDYYRECRKVVERLPVHSTVAFAGPLEPDKVLGTFAEHDAFLFPTLGENFGHVIAESLAGSCPVVCSDATPWSDVLRAGGGIICGTDESSILAAILQLTSTTPEVRFQARMRAGEAYEEWQRSRNEAHLFELLRSGGPQWFGGSASIRRRTKTLADGHPGSVEPVQDDHRVSE